MAKAKLSALFQNISGPVGNQTFYAQKGKGIIVRQKNSNPKISNTPMQVKMRTALVTHLKNWKNMPIKERMGWEFYANYLNAARKKVGNPMKKKYYNNMRGIDTYNAINQLLTAVDFETIKQPPHEKLTEPKTPVMDIIQYNTYEKEIKFLIQLPQPYIPYITGDTTRSAGVYPPLTKAQISIRTCGNGDYVYTLQPAPFLTDKPLEIIIDKIKIFERVDGNKKNIEIQTKMIKHIIVQIQARTIAQNGKFSLPSPLYTVEITNP
ncbi:MAG: hypothetical protein HY769_07270 [Candidatus Stahlbacteria bacterium]|nr:hypothetical protein [Candidatus Stahlbacteria bacterium]